MNKWIKLVLDFLAAVVSYFKGSDPAPAPSPAPSPAPPITPTPTDTQALIDAINQYRIANGVAKVVENIKLANAAQKHATWMASTNTLSHTGNGGTSPSERIRQEGYPWSMAGENIAFGYTTADSAAQGWMNSPGHRDIMLNSDYEHVGAGHAVAGKDYWVADFATPRVGATSAQMVVYLAPIKND